jgi:hypothetical protein
MRLLTSRFQEFVWVAWSNQRCPRVSGGRREAPLWEQSRPRLLSEFSSPYEADLMCGGNHSNMLNATMIVPIGTFTPDLSRRVRETAFESAQQREVIISMQATERYSWSALYDLAQSLRAAVTPHPIRLARALPRTRALLRDLLDCRDVAAATSRCDR